MHMFGQLWKERTCFGQLWKERTCFGQLWKECTCLANCERNAVHVLLTVFVISMCSQPEICLCQAPQTASLSTGLRRTRCEKGWRTSRLPSKTWGTMCGRQRASMATISIPSAFGSLDIWNSHKTLRVSTISWHSVSTIYHLQKRSTVS